MINGDAKLKAVFRWQGPGVNVRHGEALVKAPEIKKGIPVF
jgi:hypothetical protein